jgi:hypothetical protein
MAICSRIGAALLLSALWLAGASATSLRPTKVRRRANSSCNPFA